jgi:hypothetical protein
VCTVLLRFDPGSAWPVLLGAVRDEFTERPWDHPGAHWPGPWSALVGGRDRLAGGTWLAVDPSSDRPAVAALLNGPRLPPLASGTRPTRGTLALEALATGQVPEGGAIADYDSFHLLLATAEAATVWSWDGVRRTERALDPGDHILVNLGVDTADDPLVPHFLPLLTATPAPILGLPGGDDDAAEWEPWTQLLAGDGLDPDDPRALVVSKQVEGRSYGSTSATLVALGRGRARYAFNPVPVDTDAWYEVALAGAAA